MNYKFISFLKNIKIKQNSLSRKDLIEDDIVNTVQYPSCTYKIFPPFLNVSQNLRALAWRQSTFGSLKTHHWVLSGRPKFKSSVCFTCCLQYHIKLPLSYFSYPQHGKMLQGQDQHPWRIQWVTGLATINQQDCLRRTMIP